MSFARYTRQRHSRHPPGCLLPAVYASHLRSAVRAALPHYHLSFTYHACLHFARLSSYSWLSSRGGCTSFCSHHGSCFLSALPAAHHTRVLSPPTAYTAKTPRARARRAARGTRFTLYTTHPHRTRFFYMFGTLRHACAALNILYPGVVGDGIRCSCCSSSVVVVRLLLLFVVDRAVDDYHVVVTFFLVVVMPFWHSVDRCIL